MAKRVSTVNSGQDIKVTVEGLTELRRDLKAAGETLVNRGLTKELKAAAELVAADARGRIPTGPGRKGHAKDTVKAAATQRGAFVIGGKDAIPYYLWLDFGSRRPMHPGEHTNQTRSGRRAIARGVSGHRVGPWANSGRGPRGGRFIYPAIEAKSAAVVALTAKAVDSALKGANL